MADNEIVLARGMQACLGVEDKEAIAERAEGEHSTESIVPFGRITFTG